LSYRGTGRHGVHAGFSDDTVAGPAPCGMSYFTAFCPGVNDRPRQSGRSRDSGRREIDPGGERHHHRDRTVPGSSNGTTNSLLGSVSNRSRAGEYVRTSIRPSEGTSRMSRSQPSPPLDRF